MPLSSLHRAAAVDRLLWRAGGAVFVIASNVRADLHGGWDVGRMCASGGNVPAAIDPRAVYAGLLAGHLRADPAVLLPDYRGRGNRARGVGR